MRSKTRGRRKNIARRARYSTPTKMLEENANVADNTDDLRTTIYNSLDEEQRNEYFTQKCSVLNDLRKSNILCDVTLISENDVEINAHKVVLSGVSQYFFMQFTKYNEDRLLLRDFDSSTLESLVDYAYTNDITINEDNIEATFQAADYFCMEILKNVCENFLSSTISLRNCLRIRSIADRYSCESLLNTCDDFIKEHFTEVIINEEFMNFPVDGLLKMIQDNDLNVPSETTVYIIVMKWIKYDLEKRQTHLCELMHHVRLAFLGRDRLSRIFFSEPLFTNVSDMTRAQEVQRLFSEAFEEENSLSAFPLAILDKYIPIPRVSYSYSSIPKMFVIGGLRNFKSQTTVDCCSIRGTMWRSVTPLREGAFGAQAVSTRNKIYVTGSNKVEIFDMKAEIWMETVHMPRYRKHHASVLLNNKIYVIGGRSHEMLSLASVEYYCLEENKWFNVPDMMGPRALASAAVLNGKIYVVGGCKSFKSLKIYNSVEYYDPATSTWNYCKHMKYGRRGAAACVVDNLLYVVGGRDRNNFGDRFEVYDPVTDKWELMPDLPVPREYHGVCYENGYLFVVGGEWDNTYISSIDLFCFVTGQWYKMGSGLNVARSYAAVVMAYKNPQL